MLRAWWPRRKPGAAVSGGGLSLQPAIKDVVFVHLPKTAGTSLRNSLVEAMPDAVKVFTYGRHTGSIKGDFVDLSKSAAPTRDRILTLRHELPRDRRILVAGHLDASDFVGCFHPASFITFLRHPVDRIVSAYKHRVRHLNYKGSFDDFYNLRGLINTQSRRLAGIDPRDIGFIGLIEHMPDMLPALSRHLGVELRNRKDNVGRRSGGPDIDERTRARIIALNEDDLRLYRLVEANLDSFTIHRRGNFAAPATGEVKFQGGGTFDGWAAVAERPGALAEVEVKIGDHAVHRCFADQFVPDLRAGRLAPHGVGGFSVRLPPELLTGQHPIRFVFAGTDTDLDGSPIAL